MCCQSSLLLVEPPSPRPPPLPLPLAVQSKNMLLLEICVVCLLCVSGAQMSAASPLKGGSAGLKPLYYDAFRWVCTYIHCILHRVKGSARQHGGRPVLECLQ